MRNLWRWSPVLALMLVLAVSAMAGAQTRTGAWLDEVIFVREPNQSQAITRLEVGDIHLYADTISNTALFQRVQASPFLTYNESFGSYTELTFNPYGPEFQDGRLNPFSVPRIREAMNMLVDREYVANEIYGGMAVPKLFATNSAFPDYARYAAKAIELELKYAHNPQLAEQIITEEMEKLGATKVNGIWHYKGQPVEIIVLIRVEDERRALGDYVADLLEGIGFVTQRLYRTAAEASPLWIQADPSLGLMHIYTGGWISTAILRDTSYNFTQFYMPQGQASPLWEALNPPEEFREIARRLENNVFTSLEEREQLFTRAWELALEDSNRIWIVDRLSFTPRRIGVQVAADMAASVQGSWLWPLTLRWENRVGGSMTIGMPNLLVEPWNPIAGSNWVFDSMPQRGTAESGILPDPYTGLYYPRRVERAELFVKKGLPVGKTLDWVDLYFVDEIVVPEDAWIDWDPVEQRFITVGEKYPEGLTALAKSVVYYPADLFEKIKWHDGSPISLGDFVFGMIWWHDRAKPESPLYDQSYVPEYNSSMSVHKGVRIVSTNPLVIETYSDSYYLDAEWSISTWWPQYTYGPTPWHTVTLLFLAEANREGAMSAAKASLLDVEWLSMISGPSLDILKRHLDNARATNYIPFAPTLSQFISPEEAAQRYANLTRWYEQYGHFWIGTGAFYLASVHPVEGSLVLRRYENYPDPADRWSIFADPMYAELSVEGPARVTRGQTARFDLWVTFDGEPYPADLISDVSFVLISSAGEVALSGKAQLVADGLYEVVLTPEQTARLPVGATQLAGVVVPIPVAKPTMETVSFIVTP
ncbi:MAG: ABC transporter substrate-binding protein [Bacillota bacterium]